ncbi:hypothetical protein [Janthinobacterium sp. 17J80-10]|uniref:hypothetical protein n=1 Tax=Janthinobacterium sp. 17J80-10 TaxID=2497863 RepID=UPI0010054551|nr:hypothetical protein [Janthinobacterium sp. 17J80-10]QAU34943.1 hypothetical protein EKL02_12545 [Janthinobacterium sp. 17J80-10]
MKALTIKDLSRTTELDRQAMAGVSGGMYKGWLPALSVTSIDASKHSFSFEASQAIGQEQNTLVNNGNNVAFASGITSTVKPKQTADNTINFG